MAIGCDSAGSAQPSVPHREPPVANIVLELGLKRVMDMRLYVMKSVILQG